MRRFIVSPGYRVLVWFRNRQILPVFVQWTGFFLTMIGVAAFSFAEEKAPETRDICPGFLIRGEIEPGLTDVERRLVCGDPELEAWSVIPAWQAQYNLKNYLQERGFFRPVFQEQLVTDADGKKKIRVSVDVGQPTRVSAFTAVGAPPELDLGRKRKVVGEVLTPKLLGEAEGWTIQQLKALGYACPVVKSQGDPNTGEIRLTIEPGEIQNIVSLLEEPIPELMDRVLRRYDAFQIGKRFNGDWLTLTSQRLTAGELLDSAYFTVRCTPEGAVLRQEVLTGPPRLLSFGIGANTEGLLLARATWKNARLGPKASSYQMTALASTKEQTLEGVLNWYVFPGAMTRESARLALELGRRDEKFYDYGTITPQIGIQTTWDTQVLQGRARLGPTLEWVRTFRGFGPQDSHFANLNARVEIESHYFELYRTSPRTGFNLSFDAMLNSEQVGSTVSASRLKLRGEALLNLWEYDPPLVILGVRGGADTTMTGERPAANPIGTKLPPLATYYLGGSRDLRGFGRESLPGNGIGGLTSVFLGTEARFVTVLPFSLEPFVFLDAGLTGSEPFRLARPIYYSPGIGMRWAPAFGVFRTTLARGYPSDSPGGWQFYFSFGEEF